MIQFNETAADRLRTIFAEKGSPTKAFRIYLDGFG